MLLVLRRLFLLLTMLAFIGAMSVQAIPSAMALGSSDGAKPDAGCPYMAAHHADSGDPKPVKGHGIDADCIKQMGCVGTVNLPTRIGESPLPIAYRKVAYFLSSTRRAGGSVEPELLPPIGM